LAGFLRFWRLGSLPPGLHHDEAYHGLDSLSLLARETFPIYHEGWELYAQQVHDGRPIYDTTLPVFFEGNYGREGLFVYLASLPIAVLGATPIAIRAVPAIAGVLAVLATYLAASVLSEDETSSIKNGAISAKPIFSAAGPLIAAFLVAVAYPAITFSRLGERAILFLPINALVVFCFWKGIEESESRHQPRTRSGEDSALPLGDFAPRWYLMSGILLGIGLYIYAAARFLPLLFLIYVTFWFWRNRPAVQRQWANLGVMAFAAIVVALPMVIFLVRHPYYLVLRSKVIANRGAGTYPGQPWLTWIHNLGRVPRGFLWQGDPNLLHNLPGRPFLDPIQLFFVLSGLVVIILRRFKRREVFLLIWLLVMLLPGILSGDAPHFGRLIGVVPPLAIIGSLGVAWLGTVMSERLIQLFPRNILVVGGGLMILLIISATLSVYDYFGRYANQQELAEVFDAADWQLGQFAAQLPEEAAIYLTPNQEQMATIYFALEGNKEQLRSFHSPDQSLLPLGHLDQPAYYLVRSYSQEVLARMETRFSRDQLVESNSDFSAYIRTENPGGQGREDISWSGAIALSDWQVEQVENELGITLSWKTLVEMDRDYTAYVHVLSEDGSLLAQLDRPPDGYPTSDWKPGEIVQDRYAILLPSDLQSGTYLIQSGFYHLPTQERLGEPQVIGQVEIQ
jgi:4-amino-4-deoxy-L-arabinose transferase-like glycosyltransferase